MTSNSTPSDVLSQIMQAGLSKSAHLAEKQRRLLQMISASSNSEPPVDSTAPADAGQDEPAQPSAEELEEMAQRKQWTVGRNQAFADLRSKGSPQK